MESREIAAMVSDFEEEESEDDAENFSRRRISERLSDGRRSHSSQSSLISSECSDAVQLDETCLTRARDWIKENSTHNGSMLDGLIWNSACCMLTVLYCISIGVEFSLSSMGYSEETVRQVGMINYFINIIFYLEIFLRLLVEGPRAVRLPLTMLDVFICAAPLTQRVLGQPPSLRGLTALRLIRMLVVFERLGEKAWRANTELYCISLALRRPILSVLWAAVLLIPLFTGMSIVCTKVIGMSAEWNDTRDPLDEDVEPFEAFDNILYFGDLQTSALTLMQIATNAQYARHIVRPIVRAYPLSSFFFMLYIFLTTFGLTVAMMAVFTEATVQTTKRFDKQRQMREKGARVELAGKLLDLISIVDTNSDGELSAEEIDTCLANFPEFGHYLEELGLHHFDGNGIIQIFDSSGEGLVSYGEFIEGLVALDDIVDQRYYSWMALRVDSIRRRIGSFADRMEATCDAVHKLTFEINSSFAIIEGWRESREMAEMIRQMVLQARAGLGGEGGTPAFIRRFNDNLNRPKTPPPNYEKEIAVIMSRYFPGILNITAQKQVGPPRKLHAQLPGAVDDFDDQAAIPLALPRIRGLEAPWREDVVFSHPADILELRSGVDPRPKARTRWISDELRQEADQRPRRNSKARWITE